MRNPPPSDVGRRWTEAVPDDRAGIGELRNRARWATWLADAGRNAFVIATGSMTSRYQAGRATYRGAMGVADVDQVGGVALGPHVVLPLRDLHANPLRERDGDDWYAISSALSTLAHEQAHQVAPWDGAYTDSPAARALEEAAAEAYAREVRPAFVEAYVSTTGLPDAVTADVLAADVDRPYENEIGALREMLHRVDAEWALDALVETRAGDRVMLLTALTIDQAPREFSLGEYADLEPEVTRAIEVAFSSAGIGGRAAGVKAYTDATELTTFWAGQYERQQKLNEAVVTTESTFADALDAAATSRLGARQLPRAFATYRRERLTLDDRQERLSRRAHHHRSEQRRNAAAQIDWLARAAARRIPVADGRDSGNGLDAERRFAAPNAQYLQTKQAFLAAGIDRDGIAQVAATAERGNTTRELGQIRDLLVARPGPDVLRALARRSRSRVSHYAVASGLAVSPRSLRETSNPLLTPDPGPRGGPQPPGAGPPGHRPRTPAGPAGRGAGPDR